MIPSFQQRPSLLFPVTGDIRKGRLPPAPLAFCYGERTYGYLELHEGYDTLLRLCLPPGWEEIHASACVRYARVSQ